MAAAIVVRQRRSFGPLLHDGSVMRVSDLHE
jgi:hypothetical protein